MIKHHHQQPPPPTLERVIYEEGQIQDEGPKQVTSIDQIESSLEKGKTISYKITNNANITF